MLTGLLIVCFVSQNSMASEEQLLFREVRAGISQFALLHGEDGVWYVDVFEQRPGRLQKRIAHYSFPNLNSAMRTYSEMKTRNWKQSSSALIANQFSSLTTEDETDRIWQATQKWDLQWELRYADWVRTQVGPDFFVRHEIATDCADVAFALRWIFARMNGLPAANRLAGTSALFSNLSMLREWRRLPTSTNWFDDRRFLAALDYVLENTYTHTLHRDSYPVRVDEAGIIPGGFHLEIFGETGHTHFFQNIRLDNSNRPIAVLSSTVPREVRPLYAGGYWIYEQPTQAGLLRFRWPEIRDGRMKLLSKYEMPFYSEEQYSPNFMGQYAYFYQAVFTRLRSTLDPRQELQMQYDLLKERLETRIQVVDDGFVFCRQRDCSPGTVNWENWSTPGRDRRIVEQIQRIETLVADNTSYDLDRRWNQLTLTTEFTVLGRSITLAELVLSFKAGAYSSDPRDSRQSRWGIGSALIDLEVAGGELR